MSAGECGLDTWTERKTLVLQDRQFNIQKERRDILRNKGTDRLHILKPEPNIGLSRGVKKNMGHD
jgi:hypothetical protein